jgi:hypothetical protein
MTILLATTQIMRGYANYNMQMTPTKSIALLLQCNISPRNKHFEVKVYRLYGMSVIRSNNMNKCINSIAATHATI